MWANYYIEALIRERKEKNAQYYDLIGTGKMNFWRRVASRINLEFGTNYLGKQCREKFQNLVRCYRLMLKGKTTRLERKYFNEFVTEFWINDYDDEDDDDYKDEDDDEDRNDNESNADAGGNKRSIAGAGGNNIMSIASVCN